MVKRRTRVGVTSHQPGRGRVGARRTGGFHAREVGTWLLSSSSPPPVAPELLRVSAVESGDDLWETRVRDPPERCGKERISPNRAQGWRRRRSRRTRSSSRGSRRSLPTESRDGTARRPPGSWRVAHQAPLWLDSDGVAAVPFSRTRPWGCRMTCGIGRIGVRGGLLSLLFGALSLLGCDDAVSGSAW